MLEETDCGSPGPMEDSSESPDPGGTPAAFDPGTFALSQFQAYQSVLQSTTNAIQATYQLAQVSLSFTSSPRIGYSMIPSVNKMTRSESALSLQARGWRACLPSQFHSRHGYILPLF